MNRRRALTALGSAISLSGCLRLSDNGNATPTQTATARRATGRTTRTRSPTDSPTERPTDSPTERPTDSPTERPTDSPTESPDGTPPEPVYPLGLSEDGAQAVLMGTHRRELAVRGFRTNWVLVNTDKSEIKDRRTYRVADSAALGNWTFAEGGETTVYHNSQGGFWRENLGDKFTYGESRSSYSISLVTFSRWIVPVLGQGNWSSPQLVQRRKPAKWELSITGVDSSSTRIGYFDGRFESLSGSMIVDERGIIHEIDAAFTASRERGGTVAHRIRNRVGAIGSVSISEPSWLSTAKERRPTATAALTENKKFIQFELKSGNQLEPDTNITVFDEVQNTNAFTYELQDPLQAGETVYLYRTSDNRDRLARGDRPTDVSPNSFGSNYHMWAHRSLEYFGTISV